MHVVRPVRGVGDERVEGPVAVADLQVRRDLERRRVIKVVLRQVGQQRPRVVQRVVLVLGEVVGVAAAAVVDAGAAQFLEGDVLSRDRLDDVGAGDEHVGRLIHHDREVGEGRRVDVAARAGAHDQGDLRDHTGGAYVAAEDLAVQPQRGNAFLNARARALVDADDRRSDLDGQIHDLADLLAVHLAEAATENREVLGEDTDRTAADRSITDHHPVAVDTGLLHAEGRAAVKGQGVHLGERSGVEQALDPLTSGESPLRVLPGRRPGLTAMDRFVQALVKAGEADSRAAEFH